MTINEKLSRDRVSGFLRNEGGRIVNGRGEEILLCGMGVGNWLLPEGYMWKLGGRYTRPASIEGLVRHLAGSEYAARFWKTFRENYITESDVRAMAEAGFNSVRLPVNWRIVMEDEPGIRWRGDGFALIDRFLGWCEKWKLYVCLDLHGAPGGQTGHNIDDSWDDIPRLFTDTESDAREKTLALWQQFARRYRDRWIIGMYDLLNEPVRTPMEGTKELPDLSEELRAFYRDCIRAVREIDGWHMFSLESVFWASRADFFTERFDDNAAAHFHRYWCPPDITVLRDFLAVRERLGIALYLGETGENDLRWFAAMYPLALANDIGVNIWPWKKMETGNSPCSVKKPAGWDWITGFARGGDRPSYARAQAIFDEYLENIRFENCEWRPAVIPSITRSPGCVFKACDGVSFSGVERLGEGWEDARMRFMPGGSAVYDLMADGTPGVLAFTADFGAASALSVSAGDEVLFLDTVSGEREIRVTIPRTEACRVTIGCRDGSFVLGDLRWEKA
ncbi:MAG: cellulase family glycosylhydrolase [Clostridia bacterium]|nr:cellulase family glycosylhydrolase [Clostridia bacterium]